MIPIQAPITHMTLTPGLTSSILKLIPLTYNNLRERQLIRATLMLMDRVSKIRSRITETQLLHPLRTRVPHPPRAVKNAKIRLKRLGSKLVSCFDFDFLLTFFNIIDSRFQL